MAIPQYAMPQVGSFSATAAKVSLAFSYQKEWSIATALLNCGWTAGSQETGKLTLPSFPGSPAGCSCWATADGTNKANKLTSSTPRKKVSRFMMVLPTRAGVKRNSPGSWNGCRLFSDCYWLASRGQRTMVKPPQACIVHESLTAKNCRGWRP